jgi:hypothetical protein
MREKMNEELIERYYQRSKDPSSRSTLFSCGNDGPKDCEFGKFCLLLEKEDNFLRFPFPVLKMILISLRNSCHGDERSVSILLKTTTMPRIISLNRDLSKKSLEESEEENHECSNRFTEEESSQINLFSVQFICNFISTSPLGADYLVNEVGNALLHFLAAAKRFHNDKSIGILWNILFGMICNSKENYERRMQKLFEYRSLLCGLFLSLQEFQSTVSHSSSQEKQPETHSNPILEWAQMFTLQVIIQRRCWNLFSLLDSENSSEVIRKIEEKESGSESSAAMVNLEQVICLCSFITCWIVLFYLFLFITCFVRLFSFIW